MTKRTGLGHRFAVAGYDISGDVGEVGRVGGGPALLDTTGIDKSAHERVGGRFDAGVEFMSFFNDAADQAHDALSGLPTTDIVVLYAMGNTLGEPAAGLVAKQVGYDGERDEEGNFKLESQALSNGFGLSWGDLLTAWPRSDGATPTNGASLDNGAATSAGLVSYLQVFGIASGSATIAVESSSDDGGGDAFATFSGSSFSAVTAVGGERIATASGASIERYLRVATSGTFTGLSFAVMVARG